jgi:YD repeat-containing protein
MSFKQFDNEDVIVSADSISSTVWSTDTYTLSTFATSSTQEAATSGDYYLNVYQTGSDLSNAAVQFSIAYAHKDGLGSTPYNSNVAGKSPTSTIYGQYRTLVLGDEERDILFGGVTSTKGFYAISIDRARYKEKLLPGTFNLTLNDGVQNLSLTDNSGQVSTVTYNDAGRVYEIITGSNGVSYDNGTGYSEAGGYIASFGKFLPDIGVILLNGQALDSHLTSLNFLTGSADTNGSNNAKLYAAIDRGDSFKLNSEETISSNYIFVRVRNSEFNYSNNPSNITGSGELRHNSMVNNPQAYITSVGLYNDNNDLLGVAKLSKPLLKDFTKEALIRIKLDY